MITLYEDILLFNYQLFNTTIHYCDDILGAAMHVSNDMILQPSKVTTDNGKPPKSGVVTNSVSSKSKSLDKDTKDSLDTPIHQQEPNNNSTLKFDSVDFGVIKIKVITVGLRFNLIDYFKCVVFRSVNFYPICR